MLNNEITLNAIGLYEFLHMLKYGSNSVERVDKLLEPRQEDSVNPNFSTKISSKFQQFLHKKTIDNGVIDHIFEHKYLQFIP